MVAHNCEIGRHNALAAQVVFGGSSTTGDFVRCGGQAGVSDHLTLGEGASVVAKSVVTKNIPAGETWAGNLARPADVAFKIMIAQGKLPELPGRVRALEKQVAKLMEELTSLRAARDKAA